MIVFTGQIYDAYIKFAGDIVEFPFISKSVIDIRDYNNLNGEIGVRS